MRDNEDEDRDSEDNGSIRTLPSLTLTEYVIDNTTLQPNVRVAATLNEVALIS
jgi:hypothetical protein